MRINYKSITCIYCLVVIIFYIFTYILYINKFNEYLHFDNYIYLSNHNIYINKIKYIPCSSCGLGNKLLGLISSIAYGVTYSCSLKVVDWDSLWWYFLFPLKLDKHIYSYNMTFKGHFYAIKSVIDNIETRNYLLKIGLIKYNKYINVMVNNLAYKISNYFLQVSETIKSRIRSNYMNNLYFGIHIRTGKADGKEYLLHYLKYEDILNIFKFVKNIQNNQSVYISSDSVNVKYKYQKSVSKLYYLNSSICNSGFGLLKNNNKCAIEAIIDYYILSKCKYLILTRCSSFSLVSLFANKIGYENKKMYKYFGNCTLHSDFYS